jgi:REP element-mobilizing transposase RayT
MVRDVQVSAGAGYGLGLHVVWCPKYRRTVLEGQAGVCLLRAGFLSLRSGLPALWLKSYFAGAVGAATVQRYIGTPCGRPWCKERRC